MSQILIDINEQALLEAIKTEVNTALMEALNIVADECRKTVPVDTHELQNSIHIEGPYWPSPYYGEGRVVAGSESIPQAHYQEFGTVAHGPVKAKAMHFFYKGEEIFAKWVRGCTPLRWMSRAVDLSLPLVERVFQALQARTQGFVITHTVKAPYSESLKRWGVYEASWHKVIKGFGQ